MPLVINWPGRIKPAVQKDELVEFSDFLPTMCEVAEAPLPENYPGDGLSLWPVLAGTGKRNKEYVYIWYFRFTTWVRNKDFGVLRSRPSQTVRYQKYPSLFASETLDFDSASETERAVLQGLKQVMDELATADSLFMGVTAHKGRKGRTKDKPSDAAKKTQKSAAPALRKAVESAAPFSLEPAGRRYEAEAGKISGGASARAIGEGSGKSVVANMHAEGPPVRLLSTERHLRADHWLRHCEECYLCVDAQRRQPAPAAAGNRWMEHARSGTTRCRTEVR